MAIKGNFVLRSFARRKPRYQQVMPPWRGYGLHAMMFAAGYDKPADPASYDKPGDASRYDYHGLKRGHAPWALFQYTLAGQGMLTFEGRTIPVLPGQAMLLYIPHDHRYWMQPEQPWEFFFLCLHGSEVMRAWQHVVKQLGPVLTLQRTSPIRQTASRLCLDVMDEKVDSPWELSARCYQLTMQLVSLAQTSASRPKDETRKRPAAIQKVMSYAPAHLDQELDVARLAEVAGLSRHHFSRLFAASEGLGPGEYLARLRLRQAVKLLQTTSQSIKHIALDCGFADANYFSKAFAKAYGVSPRVFRARGEPG